MFVAFSYFLLLQLLTTYVIYWCSQHVFTFLIEALFPFSSVVATVEISSTVSRLECQQQRTS